MPDTSSEDTRTRDTHQKWMARRAYYEIFSTPDLIFPWWHGNPNRCKCGCGDTWYDRQSATNWWTTVTPYELIRFLIRAEFLLPVFLSLQNVIWALVRVVLIPFPMLRVSNKRRERNISTTVAAVSVRIIIVPIALSLSATIWILWPISLALLTILFLMLFGMAVIAISTYSYIFIIGGLASIVYASQPAIGVTLIVVGVLLDYERNRRNKLKQEELLGRSS